MHRLEQRVPYGTGTLGHFPIEKCGRWHKELLLSAAFNDFAVALRIVDEHVVCVDDI